MSNRYRGLCACGARVAPRAGTVHKVGAAWHVRCANCGPMAEAEAPRQRVTWRGRCEDAPCCGCCD